MGLRKTIIRGLVKSYYQKKAIKYAGLRSPWRVQSRRRSNAFGDIIEDAIDLAPQFDEAQWESGVADLLNFAEGQAGNAGQTTLIVDYLSPKAIEYCQLTQQDYDPEEFISTMKDELGDSYYNAISEIIDDLAQQIDELRDACHQSFLENAAFRLGTGFGYAFMHANTPNRQYGNMASAFAAYGQAAARNGYRTSGSAADARFNSEKNRQNLIKKFGKGPTQPWKSASGMDMVPGYAGYQQAAARNNRIIKP
ncbi:hypothetical protein UFOVP721_5 [uncultured Caudovirales phage]|uniref:Uncharacterized protein n=1 Tax=uncultured Caudovirales phage TaxID=2100421 RepID=A0A6J5NLU1_9CAUD|nr:hypothetical protein UFOVP721_5 [uncultured Caudovirales phage]